MATASAAVMWTATVCGLWTILGAFDTMVQGSRVLETPTKMAVVFEDQFSALLFWEFTEPQGTNLGEIEFILYLLDSKRVLEEFKVQAGRRPFHFKFKRLTPKTEYTVKLWASSPALGYSPLTKIPFTTMGEDWPIPTLTNVTARRTPEAMQYTVSWELNSLPVELSCFDIVLCSDECETMRTLSSEFSITFPISFYTEFSLNVTAIYDIGVGLRIRRTSSEYHSISEMGAPSKVQNVTDVHQVGNKFRIDWLPPDPPNGPLSYYEVFIYDPRAPEDASGVEVHSGTSATLFAPQLGGGAYKIQITAINVDRDGVEYSSKVAVFTHERILPSGSPSIKVLHRDANSIHFKMIAENPQENLRFDFVAEKSWSRLFNKPDEIEVFNLNPFEPIAVDLRTCYATSHYAIHTCGYFTQFNLTTNVGAPSGVTDLEIEFVSRTRIRASWNPPLTPNGPIDGYTLNVSMGLPKVGNITRRYRKGESLVMYLPSHVRRVEVDTPREWRSVRVGVAAWNEDSDYFGIEYEGPMVFKSLEKSGYSLATQITITVTYMIFGLAAILWAAREFARYVIRCASAPPRPEHIPLDVIQGVPDPLRGNQLEVDLLQGVPDRQRDD